MWQTSDSYKAKIYEPSTKQISKVYINGTEIESKYILGCKPTQKLFVSDKFELGCVTSQTIELKLHKNAITEEIEQVYIETGIAGEIVPVGYFNVDDINREDDYVVTLKLLDNMIKFEFNYDGSSLIAQKGYAEIIEVLQDMCSKAGVELRFYFFFEYA